MLRNRLFDRTRIEVDARSPTDLARRTAQHRRNGIESIFAAARGWPLERKNRCGISSAGKRYTRIDIPCSRQGALDGGFAERSPSRSPQSRKPERFKRRDICGCIEYSSRTSRDHRQVSEAVWSQRYAIS